LIEELLRLYNSELQYVRKQGDEFSRSHPEVAAHLRVGSEGKDDPYVGRLIQAFALLTARVRLKIEDEFPEIVNSLLDVILPHYLRSIPSISVAEFVLDLSQQEAYGGHRIEARSLLESEPIEGEPCQFRTCYPVTCWPFKISGISLRGLPFETLGFSLPKDPLGVLKLRMETFGKDKLFSSYLAKSLRFFIKLPAPFSYQLYELINSSCIKVGIAGGKGKHDNAILLDRNRIRPVGFSADEGLVDYPPQSFLGYRLLSEYFAFPEKFLFIDLDLGDSLAKMNSSDVCLHFYLDRRWQDLESQINERSLVLNCSPIINLFSKRTEPIRFDHQRSSYHVIPDSRRPRAHEIYSIEQVTGTSASGEIQFKPFYSCEHSVHNQSAYWNASRRMYKTSNSLDEGIEFDISFVNLDFAEPDFEELHIEIDTLCSNRNLPSRMKFDEEHPKLHLETGATVKKVKCLIKPTDPFRTPLGKELRWRCVSHLSLNHLSLVDDNQGATALRELLKLYDFRNDSATAGCIAGLSSIRSRAIMGRVPGDRSGALCRGTLIELSFDETKYTSGNLFLFASVLESFFALYSNINSFTQTVAKSDRRQGEIYRWPARAGLQPIV
jgi:type VI secretion system protein ImpG